MCLAFKQGRGGVWGGGPKSSQEPFPPRPRVTPAGPGGSGACAPRGVGSRRWRCLDSLVTRSQQRRSLELLEHVAAICRTRRPGASGSNAMIFQFQEFASDYTAPLILCEDFLVYSPTSLHPGVSFHTQTVTVNRGEPQLSRSVSRWWP